jgi:hypothetical protein
MIGKGEGRDPAKTPDDDRYLKRNEGLYWPFGPSAFDALRS